MTQQHTLGFSTTQREVVTPASGLVGVGKGEGKGVGSSQRAKIVDRRAKIGFHNGHTLVLPHEVEWNLLWRRVMYVFERMRLYCYSFYNRLIRLTCFLPLLFISWTHSLPTIISDLLRMMWITAAKAWSSEVPTSLLSPFEFLVASTPLAVGRNKLRGDGRRRCADAPRGGVLTQRRRLCGASYVCACHHHRVHYKVNRVPSSKMLWHTRFDAGSLAWAFLLLFVIWNTRGIFIIFDVSSTTERLW